MSAPFCDFLPTLLNLRRQVPVVNIWWQIEQLRLPPKHVRFPAEVNDALPHLNIVLLTCPSHHTQIEWYDTRMAFQGTIWGWLFFIPWFIIFCICESSFLCIRPLLTMGFALFWFTDIGTHPW
jgi:hypothetical protein